MENEPNGFISAGMYSNEIKMEIRKYTDQGFKKKIAVFEEHNLTKIYHPAHAEIYAKAFPWLL